MTDESLVCSFCSKSRKDVTKMIVGATKVAICNECVKLCIEILEEDNIKSHREKFFHPKKELMGFRKKEWEELTKETFNRVFKKSAIKRAKFNGLKRNIKFLKTSSNG